MSKIVLLLQVTLSLKPDSLRAQALDLTLTPLTSPNPKVRIMTDQEAYNQASDVIIKGQAGQSCTGACLARLSMYVLT